MNSNCQSSQEHNDRPMFENLNFFDTHTAYYIDNGIDLTLEFPSPFFLQQLSVQSRATQKTKLMKMSSRIGGAMEKNIDFQKQLSNSLSIVHSYHWGVKFSLPCIVSIGMQAAKE